MESRADAMVKLLNFCANHLDNVVRYKANEIILGVHSNKSYLSRPKECRRDGGHLFYKKKPKIGQLIMNNGLVHFIATITHHVMSSVSKSEVAALLINAKGGIIFRNYLKRLGHPQQAPPLQTDN